MSEPTADVLTYNVSVEGYGGPTNVHLNGTRLKGVQKIIVEHMTEDFSEVTIVLRATTVQVDPVS